MTHYKCKKSKRNVVCTICTPFKWMGNCAEKRHPVKRGRLMVNGRLTTEIGN